MDHIEIDGSYGEGGGQILRSAIALSSILQKSITIKNIRKDRPHPGLGIQHVRSIALARDMTDARVEGLVEGSTQITFVPGSIRGGHYSLDMGTAGSITLALQTVLPIAIFAPSPVTFDMTGGTDVKWSPTFDYFENVMLSALGEFGANVKSSLERRGYFPRGNGKVTIHVEPSTLHSAKLAMPIGRLINGVSASSGLPAHVVERQAKGAAGLLNSKGLGVGDIRLDPRNDGSTGSSITLFKGFIGASALGERGVPAEKVGREAAVSLLSEIGTGAAVDSRMADQIILFMSLAKGHSSILTGHLTGHTSTNIWVIEQITGRKFEVIKNRAVLIRSL